MSHSKACSTPLDTKRKLSKEEGEVMRNSSSYKQILGAL